MLMTNEMHNSYNKFLFHSYLSALHVSKESSRSKHVKQTNNCGIEINYKNCASRWSLTHCNMMHSTHNVTLTHCNMMHGTHNVTLTHCNMMHGTHKVTLTNCNMMHGTYNVTLTHCNMVYDTHNVTLTHCNMMYRTSYNVKLIRRVITLNVRED